MNPKRRRWRRRKAQAAAVLLFLLVLGWGFQAPALTLREAVEAALGKLPSIAAARRQIDSSKALKSGSLSPYLPSLDLTGTADSVDSQEDSYHTEQGTAAVNYTIYDGGIRRADRKIASIRLDSDQEELRKVFLDVERDVKVAFYDTLAQNDILDQRILQVQDAQTVLDVAEGRFRFGVAKRSDVLQASVRLEQARFQKIQAEGELNKSLATLNSLAGRPLETSFDLEGSLDPDGTLAERAFYTQVALKRPMVQQAEQDIQIAEAEKAKTLSPFLPALEAQVAYSETESTQFGGLSNEQTSVGLVARWNLFEWNKFTNRLSAGHQVAASEARFEELKRQVRVEVNNRYEDVVTAMRNVRTAEEQLRQAEHNYRQAFGEYKVGKGDILSLVQAESALATAREQLVDSRRNVWVSWAQLERAAGIFLFDPLSFEGASAP